MNEKDELNQELQLELQWVKYRQKMLDIIEGKLLQMRLIVDKVKYEKFNLEELEALNIKLNYLASQILAIDSESRINIDGKILN